MTVIKGIGIDIIELDRIRKSMENERFLDRVLTPNERNLLKGLKGESRRVEFVAGRFAAKEAFAKAMGTGIGKLSFQDIEIINDEKGKPIVTVSLLDKMNIFVSISHSKEYAVAQVVLED
jgi:holo-[acyl-carrier protein] synthase